jgi:hypothetical protein
MKPFLRAAVLTAFSLLCLAAPASADPPLPDAVMSANVEYLGSIKQDVGLTTGAKVIGDRMFVTSGKNISIYDISDPASPQPLGGMKANVAWENEEVPTNGKVLAVASDFYSVGVPESVAAMAPTGCVQLFDVRDPSNIRQVGTIPIANHTAECVLDCQYFYGRAGTIIDARGVLDGTPPKVVGNWIDELRAQGVDSKSCHHIREIRPGVLLTACQPFAAISVNAEDGGSPEHPKVLYTGAAAKFVHSARWPREGADKFVLIGGEQNFTGRCERNNSEFSVYGASGVLSGQSKQFEGPLAQVPPAATASTPTASPSRARSAAPCTGSRSTRPSTTAGSSRSPSTRTACASCRSSPTGRLPSRATSSRSAAPRPRPSGRGRTTSCTRSTTSAGSTSCAGRASTTSRPASEASRRSPRGCAARRGSRHRRRRPPSRPRAATSSPSS